VQALRGKLHALEREVSILRERLRLLEPTLTQLMPDFAERLHVMHRAGEAGGWAVAKHKLVVMQRTAGVAREIAPERAHLMDVYMNPVFESLNRAIEHTDKEAFSRALEQTIQNTNACHNAVGSPFIEVVLDAKTSLSMRHPHELDHSQPPPRRTPTRTRAAITAAGGSRPTAARRTNLRKTETTATPTTGMTTSTEREARAPCPASTGEVLEPARLWAHARGCFSPWPCSTVLWTGAAHPGAAPARPTVRVSQINQRCIGIHSTTLLDHGVGQAKLAEPTNPGAQLA